MTNGHRVERIEWGCVDYLSVHEYDKRGMSSARMSGSHQSQILAESSSRLGCSGYTHIHLSWCFIRSLK